MPVLKRLTQTNMMKTNTKYRGVYWHKATAKWIAVIKVDGRQIYLGSHAAKKDASIAYNAVARFIEKHA